MKIMAVIPARYASTRLPGKPLVDILGKPMIQRVYENALCAEGIDDVIIATDDQRIAKVIEKFDGKYIMTSPDCKNGTERLFQVATLFKADVYINIQGDEPLLSPTAISKLALCMRQENNLSCATLYRTASFEEAANPNLVKVVFDNNNNALYFSRARIPYPRDGINNIDYFVHVGIYAYKSGVLQNFVKSHISSLENVEKLEQLRLLQLGIPIRMIETSNFGPGVDTSEDLDEVRRILSGVSSPGIYKEELDENITIKKSKISFVVTDVDGILTDGSLYYTESGESMKAFTARDGIGFKMLAKAGIKTAVLSGRDSPALRRRLNDLGIEMYLLGFEDKTNGLLRLMHDANKTSSETLYIGDDKPDAEAFSICGLSCTVNDAHPLAKEKADWVLSSRGGKGAMHEIADELLKARGSL